MAASQPELFAGVLASNPKFADYVRGHPDAYQCFAIETLRALRCGTKPGEISAKAIAELCRPRVRDGIDNCWITLLSRLFEEREGREVFRKRRRRVE